MRISEGLKQVRELSSEMGSGGTKEFKVRSSMEARDICVP